MRGFLGGAACLGAAGAAGLLLTACRQAAVDDAPFIAGTGFNEPIVLSGKMAEPYEFTPFVPLQSKAAALALLAKGGTIRAEPATGGEPWWRFAPASVSVPLAHRKITGKDEVKRWREGPVEFFAETVRYTVEVESGFKGLDTRSFGPFSFRLVLVNSPQIGHWARSEPDAADRLWAADTKAVMDAVVREGTVALPSMQESIGDAQLAAYDEIERNLKSTGLLERSPKETNVLLSKANRLAFFTGSPTFSGITVGEIVGYCRDLKAGGFDHWRLPSSTELRALTETTKGLQRLVDTPDRRLWGDLAVPLNNQSVMVPTKTFGANNGQLHDLEAPPASAYGTALHVFILSYQGLFQQNGVGLWLNTFHGNEVYQVSYSRPIRIACVADLT